MYKNGFGFNNPQWLMCHKTKLNQTKKAVCNSNSNINRKKKKKWEEKQLHGHFKQQTGEIAHEKPRAWQRKGDLKRETESLLILAQNNAIRTNYIKVKIDNMQQHM